MVTLGRIQGGMVNPKPLEVQTLGLSTKALGM